MDQIWVELKHWLVSLAPAAVQPWLAALISVAAIIGVFAGLFALTTLLERKGLGRMQNRYGPNRVGPFGLLQPIADGIKSLTKEDIVPRSADAVVHYLAPLVLVVPVFLALAVVPVGRNMVAVELDAGVLFFFAVGAATELSVFMAGWSSRNKYSLLGAMRGLAQMISYEVPLILSSVTVIMMAGSLSTQEIVRVQSGYWGVLPQWNVLTPWGFAGFILFMIGAAAESNRSPFDLPEGESEIIAGYYIEYSGFKFALFFLGEYIGMFAISGLGNHSVPGWVDCATVVPYMGAFVDLVFWQIVGADLLIYLGARHASTAADGSADEFCVEIHAPTGANQYRGRRVVAIHAAGTGALGGLRNAGGGALRFARAGALLWREVRAPNVPICRHMSAWFYIIALLIVGSAVAAMSLRNLVHCALSLALTFAGLALAYLQLQAQFVGFAQVLVYVGAVAILIVFAILLTRGSEPEEGGILSPGWLWGLGIAALTFVVAGGAVLSSKLLPAIQGETPAATVKQIGDQLMTKYILPLEVIGLLLTAALIGAVIIAMREKEGGQ